jgi:hypothetical protein
MVCTETLYREHGRVNAQQLPVKTGPKYGMRAFTDQEEERIYLFVKVQGNSPEAAAVACRVSKVTIDNVCARVRSRLGDAPGSGKHEGRATADDHGDAHGFTRSTTSRDAATTTSSPEKATTTDS